MALPQEQEITYTIDDIYNLPEGTRAELFGGQIHYMTPPSTKHQRLLKNVLTIIDNYINLKNGSCEVLPAPFAVFLNKDDKTYVEPDISVICDPNKINDKGCNGAPDWIIEITSPSNSVHDYIDKLSLYKSAGVREYWILNPQKQIIAVYYFTEENFYPQNYTFKDKIKVNIYDDLIIDFNEISI